MPFSHSICIFVAILASYGGIITFAAENDWTITYSSTSTETFASTSVLEVAFDVALAAADSGVGREFVTTILDETCASEAIGLTAQGASSLVSDTGSLQGVLTQQILATPADFTSGIYASSQANANEGTLKFCVKVQVCATAACNLIINEVAIQVTVPLTLSSSFELDGATTQIVDPTVVEGVASTLDAPLDVYWCKFEGGAYVREVDVDPNRVYTANNGTYTFCVEPLADKVTVNSISDLTVSKEVTGGIALSEILIQNDTIETAIYTSWSQIGRVFAVTTNINFDFYRGESGPITFNGAAKFTLNENGRNLRALQSQQGTNNFQLSFGVTSVDDEQQTASDSAMLCARTMAPTILFATASAFASILL